MIINFNIIFQKKKKKIPTTTAQGEERNPKFNPEDNVARKGYLNNYKKVDKQNPYAVDIDSLCGAVGSSSSCLPDKYFDLHQSKLHPKVCFVVVLLLFLLLLFVVVCCCLLLFYCCCCCCCLLLLICCLICILICISQNFILRFVLLLFYCCFCCCCLLLLFVVVVCC